MFHDDLIRQIIDAWIRDQNHPRRNRQPLPIPQFNQIKSIIEIAFKASLKREEERPVKFALILADNASIPDTDVPDGAVLHFTHSLPFTVDTICKLASSLDPTRSAIAVGPIGNNSDLLIWGILTFSRPSHRFNELSVQYGPPAVQPDHFTVYVNHPGSLLIARACSQIGRVMNGTFFLASPTSFAPLSLGKYLSNAIQENKLYKEFGNIYWQLYSATIQVMLTEATSRGHGSTIVLLDQANLLSCSQHSKSRYSFQEGIGFKTLFEDLLKSEEQRKDIGGILSRLAIKKLILERIEILAQFAAVDGAVLLKTDLELVGYGCTLSAPQWNGQVVIGPDANGDVPGKKIERERFGTRHNSAIDFVGSYPGSVVFVISQDGPARAFVRSNDTVFCWLDCGS